jgi:hypothetical protein
VWFLGCGEHFSSPPATVAFAHRRSGTRRVWGDLLARQAGRCEPQHKTRPLAIRATTHPKREFEFTKYERYFLWRMAFLFALSCRGIWGAWTMDRRSGCWDRIEERGGEGEARAIIHSLRMRPCGATERESLGLGSRGRGRRALRCPRRARLKDPLLRLRSVDVLRGPWLDDHPNCFHNQVCEPYWNVS